MQHRFTGLWRHADFMRLWVGQSISAFGSMVGTTAMSFTAILFLQATPFQMGVLNTMNLVPALLASLFAGAWVDRLPRRPLMIAVDLGRAAVLASIPIAALAGRLHITQVYAVALVISILTILFELAYQTYLPGLVGKDQVVEGNSKLSASSAAAEFGGFSLGGWLVQLLTAPLAILIDAVSFVVSAVSLGLVRAREPEIPPQEHPDLRREIAAGLRTVLRDPLLAASGRVILVNSLANGIYGTLVVLYMARDIGFNPGILGMIWAVGGVSSFTAAALTPRLTRRLGLSHAMLAGLLVFSLLSFLVPIAHGPTWISAILLIVPQLSDGFYVLYEINLVSLRQRITAESILGRVNATLRFLSLAGMLAGALLGGLLGNALGARPALLLGSLGFLLSAVLLWLSPLSSIKEPAEI